MLTVTPIPAFRDNYLWTLHAGGNAVVVDPGDAVPVKRFLAERSLKLSAILITHHHADHVDGLAELARGRDIPVFGPAGERIAGLTHRLREGDTATLPGLNLSLRVVELPGHTLGHIGYLADGMLFCGDTLFACGCGRLFEGTPAQMLASLDKLAALPPDTRVYCTHEYTLSNIRFARVVEPGNRQLAEREERESAKRAEDEPTLPSTIALEAATNPFVRCREPEVAAAAEARAGRALAGPVETFAVLREWKNVF